MSSQPTQQRVFHRLLVSTRTRKRRLPATISDEALVAGVLAKCETPTEKKERLLCCKHGAPKPLCLKCAQLGEHIEEWRGLTTRERRIKAEGVSLGRYIRVRVSTKDCALVSRAKASPSEPLQFDPELDAALREPRTHQESHPESSTKVRSVEGEIARDLFNDPASGFQAGGTGYFRQPLDAPRESRAEAPGWLEFEGQFLNTLRQSRRVRAEEILRAFYKEEKTDKEIADALGWRKDSVKKERQDLVQRGIRFFEKHPLAPLCMKGRKLIYPTLYRSRGTPIASLR